MGKTTATYEEVKQFLDQMKTWLTILGGFVVYDRKEKNEQFMVDMDWTKPDKKKEWLLKLEPEDYFMGPDPNETPGRSDVWQFGKRIENKLCYIKIYLLKNPNVYCISFHLAEHDMKLPHKNTIETI